jgi:hypothetical protein
MTTLPKRTTLSVATIDMADIITTDMLDGAADLFTRSRHYQQVHMVRTYLIIPRGREEI